VRWSAVIFNLLERHRDKWVEDGECYRWIAALGGNSKSLQGVVGVNRKIVRVPRIVCGEAHGPPPTPKHHAAHDTPNGCIEWRTSALGDSARKSARYFV